MNTDHPEKVSRNVNPNLNRAGRPKGVPNKMTKALKEMILGALDDAGGQNYLLEQSEKNPAAFMTLIGKVLPTTLANDPDNPLTKIPDDELHERLKAAQAMLAAAQQAPE